jgi:hypothetical protein
MREKFIALSSLTLMLLGCGTLREIPLYAAVPAGSAAQLSREDSALREACRNRANGAAERSNRLKKKSRTWKRTFGTLGAVSAGFAGIAAVPPVRDNLGGYSASLVSVSTAALSAVLATLVPSTEDAGSSYSEFSILSGELEQGDKARGEERRRAYKNCAFGHEPFEAPIPPVPEL